MKYPVSSLVAAISIGLAMVPATATRGAADPWTVQLRTYVDRAASESDDEASGAQTKLQPRLGAAIEATRSVELDDGRSAAFSFGVTHDRFPDNSKDNRFFFDAGAEHVTPLRWGALRQLRLFVDVTHARDEEDWVFNRIRAGAALRFQPMPRNSVQLRARFGYRDQNDDHTFLGYDQSEFLLDLAHNWRSEDGVRRLNSTVFYERRNADNSIYSYDEAGIRLVGRYRLNDKIDLVGRATGFLRDYDTGGRRDERLRATAGVDWNLNEKTVIETFVGYQQNNSTLQEKDYDGAVLGLQLTKQF